MSARSARRHRRGPAAVDLPYGSSPAELAIQLRAGVSPPDPAFDQHLPAELRAASSRHWTPLHIVSRGVRWLQAAGARSVVDVGSGAGKFCVVAALCSDLTVTGLEQRPRLVAAARALARLFAVDHRVRFDEVTFGLAGAPAADAYYFFNPFAENIFGQEDRIDADVEHGYDRFSRETRAARAFFKELPPGTLVLTYHGFGGEMPHGLEELRRDTRIPALLRLWRRTARPR